MLQNASCFVIKCDVLKQNRHYLWNQHHKGGEDDDHTQKNIIYNKKYYLELCLTNK